ncbi:hypothetical protein PAXY110619_25100 [Paenibacillus xylanexedens]|uniref:Uncharacterized protein n=1 Tax=Paenibacillus xylanexedens TaxID=528191 RepID=A0ABS4RTF5_PAEXY|nr:hypothetical protein [Paenibacillus xylanexedens]
MLSDGRKIGEVITFVNEAGVRRVSLMLIALVIMYLDLGEISICIIEKMCLSYETI